MSRRVDDAHLFAAKVDRFAVGERLGERWDPRGWDPKTLGDSAHTLKQAAIRRMQPHGGTGRLDDGAGAHDVIDMAVRLEHEFYVEVVRLDDPQESFRIVARIDDHGLPRSLAGNDRAVAAEDANRNGPQQHLAVGEASLPGPP